MVMRLAVALSTTVLSACATTPPEQITSAQQNARLCTATAPAAKYDQCMRDNRANRPTFYSVADERQAIHRALSWLYRHPDSGDELRRTERILDLKARLQQLPESGLEWGLLPLPRNEQPDLSPFPGISPNHRMTFPSR